MSTDHTVTIHVAAEAVTRLVSNNSPALAARLALADFEAECGRLPPGSYVEVWWDADGEGRSGGVRYKNLDAVRTALPGDEPAAIEKISAAVRLSQTFEKWLSHEEAVVACRNVGVDLTCGGCAEAFYTGHFAGHDPGCRTENSTTPQPPIVSTLPLATQPSGYREWLSTLDPCEPPSPSAAWAAALAWAAGRAEAAGCFCGEPGEAIGNHDPRCPIVLAAAIRAGQP